MNIHLTKKNMNLYLHAIVVAVTAVLVVSTLAIAKTIVRITREKILKKLEQAKISLSRLLTYQNGDGKLSRKKNNNFNLLILLYQQHLLLIRFLPILNTKQKKINYQKRLSFSLIKSFSDL